MTTSSSAPSLGVDDAGVDLNQPLPVLECQESAYNLVNVNVEVPQYLTEARNLVETLTTSKDYQIKIFTPEELEKIHTVKQNIGNDVDERKTIIESLDNLVVYNKDIVEKHKAIEELTTAISDEVSINSKTLIGKYMQDIERQGEKKYPAPRDDTEKEWVNYKRLITSIYYTPEEINCNLYNYCININ